ncbi:MAG: hypothetical protein H6R08_577 [Proteobacteria bacterium]|nr:hypothetical protein [Pseudomonadota bacterium]
MVEMACLKIIWAAWSLPFSSTTNWSNDSIRPAQGVEKNVLQVVIFFSGHDGSLSDVGGATPRLIVPVIYSIFAPARAASMA